MQWNSPLSSEIEGISWRLIRLGRTVIPDYNPPTPYICASGHIAALKAQGTNMQHDQTE